MFSGEIQLPLEIDSPILRQKSKISGVNHPLSHFMTLIEVRVNNLFGMSGAGFS